MGVTLVSTYAVTWDDADPCATLALNPVSATNSGGQVKEVWRLRARHSGDKGTVLYQTGYEQQLFIEPVYNVPKIDRDLTTRVNGFGSEITRNSRTVEKVLLRFRICPITCTTQWPCLVIAPT